MLKMFNRASVSQALQGQVYIYRCTMFFHVQIKTCNDKMSSNCLFFLNYQFVSIVVYSMSL